MEKDRDTISNANTIFDEGIQLWKAGKLIEAIAKLQESLNLFRISTYREGEAAALTNLGLIYYALDQKQRALENFNAVLPICQEVDDEIAEAMTLNNIGQVYTYWGRDRDALPYYQRSLTLKEKLDDSLGVSTLANKIGQIYSALGQLQNALEAFEQSLSIKRTLGDLDGEASTLNNIGLLYVRWGCYQTAWNMYEQAVAICRETDNRPTEVIVLANLGSGYSRWGDKTQALEFYEQAFEIACSLRDRLTIAGLLNNLGSIYSDLGEKHNALDRYQKALSLLQNTGSFQKEASLLNSIGAMHDDLGAKQLALEYYERGLALQREIKDSWGEASSLNNIGSVYRDLGEGRQALEYFLRALEGYQAANNSFGVAIVLRNIGSIYYDDNNPEKALTYFEKTAEIDRALNNPEGEASALNNIASIYKILERYQDALDYYNRSLTLRNKLSDRVGIAQTLNNIGSVYKEMGKTEQAISYFERALPFWQETEDKAGEISTRYWLTVIEYNRGNLERALEGIQTVVAQIEALRSQVVISDLQATYFASKHGDYELYIAILMQLHERHPNKNYHEMALNIVERVRARSLSELIGEARTKIANNSELRQQEQQLLQRLAAKNQARYQLFNHRNIAELSQGEQKQAEHFQQEIGELQRQLQAIEVQIRQENPRYAALQPSLIPDKVDIWGIVDEDTLLLFYWLNKECSYLWLVAPTQISSYVLADSKTIDLASQAFYESLTIPKLRARKKKQQKAAEKLSEILLEPIATQLGTKRLAIVADGALHRLPFAAIADPNCPEKPLIAGREIVYLPSASTLSQIRQKLSEKKPSSKTIAIFADPVFAATDKRAGGNGDDPSLFKPLTHSRSEADAIAAIVPESQREIFLDFAASREQLQNIEMSQYRILHLVTHGVYNGDRPEHSGFVLSLVDKRGQEQEGFVLAPDIINLNLSAELVVLSACDTGKGKEVKGEGVMGIARGFLCGGTARVIMSLWKVDDEATAWLMENFYKKMLEEGYSPAKALRETQIEMWQHSDWKDPYYWASFVIQGEWRNSEF